MSAAIVRVDRTETFNGWPVTFVEGEPLIEDIELGRRLGYERPSDVRKIIGRLFNDNALIATVAQSTGGRPARVALLTESQALLVCMRSDTETAALIQVEIARVFLAVAKGRLATAVDIPSIVNAAVKATVSELAPMLHTMMQQAQANSETIGPRRARQLLARIRAVSRRYRPWRSKHREIQNVLRERCGAPISGAWERLPARYWPELDLEMSRIEADENRRNPPQLTLAVGGDE